MHETRWDWQQEGYVEQMADVFARNESARAADHELSERLAREWAELDAVALAA